MGKRIGYAKIGRSIGMDPDKFGFQGDAEAPNLLRRLALRNPDTTFVLVGRNSGGDMCLPNVKNPWDNVYQGGTYYNSPSDKAKARLEERFPDATYHAYKHGKGTGFFVERKGRERDIAISNIISRLDGIIVHAGQMGTSHISIPPSNTTWLEAEVDPARILTMPQISSQAYGTYLVEGLNELGNLTNGKAPVVWLCADPRNFLKDRSYKWPMGVGRILAQYSYNREQRHERFKDPRSPRDVDYHREPYWARTDRGGEIWIVKHQYVHADLELMILPDDWPSWGQPTFDDRSHFGIASTSFGIDPGPKRSELIRDYFLTLGYKVEVWGKWDAISLMDVPAGTVQLNHPTQFQRLLESWRVTAALPPIGSGWTAAKPWQCFAANVACFFIGKLDDHGWMLPTRTWTSGCNIQRLGNGLYSVRDDWTDDELKLASILRVKSVAEFHQRAIELANDKEKWYWVIRTQRQLLTRRWAVMALENEIESMLELQGDK